MSVKLSSFFARCCVVNLARRPDRWEAFQKRIAESDWPFVTPERFDAVDGQLVPFPKWWTAGKGAWGVYRSFTRIIEVCLNEQVPSVLILEDDAVPCANFRAKVQAYLDAIPADWQQVYLGGQHLDLQNHPPKKVNDLVFVPWNVNRLHAWGVNTAGMKTIYRHILRTDWTKEHHIDHHMGRLHMTGKFPVYTPSEWLIGQSEGQSNICGKDLERRFWKNAADIGKMPNVVAVIGPFRSGTSCVAGICHTLGISMGREFWHKPNAKNARGYFEAKYLTKLCQRSFKEPLMHVRNSRPERVKLLREWAMGRSGDCNPIGAKHPALCLMGFAMKKAWGPTLKVIAVTRPVPDALKSLEKTGWWPKIPAKKKRAAIERMLRQRDGDLKKHEIQTLYLNYEEVLENPRQTVNKIIGFTGIAATPEQIEKAVAFVDPKLNHSGRHGGAPDSRELVAAVAATEPQDSCNQRS